MDIHHPHVRWPDGQIWWLPLRVHQKASQTQCTGLQKSNWIFIKWAQIPAFYTPFRPISPPFLLFYLFHLIYLLFILLTKNYFLFIKNHQKHFSIQLKFRILFFINKY